MKKARVRFDTEDNNFVVDIWKGWWRIGSWVTVKTDRYNHPARSFGTYGQAYEFAVKCTTDVEIIHKNNTYDPV